jgi:hypothetical protein
VWLLGGFLWATEAQKGESMSWNETGEIDFPLYRFILSGYMVSEQGEVIAYRFGLLQVKQVEPRSAQIGKEDWVSQYSLDEFLCEYDSLVLKGTKEMLSDGSFRWRVTTFNRDIELVKEGRAALVFTGGSSTTTCFYLLSETGSFVHKGFAGGDAQKIKERLFNGEMDIADDEFVSEKYRSYLTLGEEYRGKYAVEIARDALTKRNISEIYFSEAGNLCARGLKGVSNGVNSYPSFVQVVTVSMQSLCDSKTEVLDMSKCEGLKSVEVHAPVEAYHKKLPSLSLIFPTELREEVGMDYCLIRLNVWTEELKFISFPKGAIFNKLIVEGAKIAGIDGVIKVGECEICNCTGLSELSIEAGEGRGDRGQEVRLVRLDTVKLSVTVDSFEHCAISFSNLEYLKELIFTVSKEETHISIFTKRYMGFNINSGGIETLVIEGKKGLIFGGYADFSSMYPSLKRLEIRGDIAFWDNVEDEVVFVPRGCKVVCNNAEFIKHVRER